MLVFYLRTVNKRKRLHYERLSGFETTKVNKLHYIAAQCLQRVLHAKNFTRSFCNPKFSIWNNLKCCIAYYGSLPPKPPFLLRVSFSINLPVEHTISFAYRPSSQPRNDLAIHGTKGFQPFKEILLLEVEFYTKFRVENRLLLQCAVRAPVEGD